MTQPIDLYYWPTPNGWKITIFLEEAGLPYNVIPVDIGAGDQFEPEFLEISPNNKMPAIVDPDGPDGNPIPVFESGAILIYLSEKLGFLIPESPRGRYEVLQWLMFQMGTVGPMLGQAHHFRKYSPEEIPYAIERYTNEAARIYDVMDRRLSDQGQSMSDYPNLARWFETVGSRPAVERALQVGAELRRPLSRDMDERTREMLFGNRGRR
jgi:GSH-dependent disulfide-bond oxidoreductase